MRDWMMVGGQRTSHETAGNLGLGSRRPGVLARALIVVLAVCALLPLGFVARLVLYPDVLFPDFFGLWSFGRFVLTHHPASVYDDVVLHDFQASFGLPPDASYSFLYPPPVLLVLAAFGALPYGVARIAWLVLTFAAYAAALTAWRWPRVVAALLVLAPASAVSFLVGQNGFLVGALMLGGVRLLRPRPLLAGALLAGVGIKPQLAPLIPFALLFGGHWRALVGAALMAVVLVLATSLAFGMDAWADWLDTLGGHRIAAGRDVLLQMMPTVTSAVLLLGGASRLALLAQAAGVAAALLALWRVRRRDDTEARAVLPVATLLATPYAFHYDLPMVTGAVLAVIAARMAAAGRFGGVEFPLLVAAVAVPAILPAHVGAASAVLPVMFAGVLWTLTQVRRGRAQTLPSRPAPA
jgi:hypothetical protein